MPNGVSLLLEVRWNEEQLGDRPKSFVLRFLRFSLHSVPSFILLLLLPQSLIMDVLLFPPFLAPPMPFLSRLLPPFPSSSSCVSFLSPPPFLFPLSVLNPFVFLFSVPSPVPHPSPLLSFHPHPSPILFSFLSKHQSLLLYISFYFFRLLISPVLHPVFSIIYFPCSPSLSLRFLCFLCFFVLIIALPPFSSSVHGSSLGPCMHDLNLCARKVSLASISEEKEGSKFLAGS